MKTIKLHRLLWLCVCLLVMLSSATAQVVISQVYGGGGGTSPVPTYKNDYIELYNSGSTAVSLAGYSVQYGSASGTGSWSATALSGSIPAHSYFLIQEGGGSAGGTLPTADVTGTLNLSASNGKVALVSSTTALSGACPTTNVVDVVGYGTANCYETTATAALTSTTAAIRIISGTTAQDTGSNVADFTVTTPNPHNSSTSLDPTGISGSGSASPATATSGSTSVLLTVTVTPASSPTSTWLAVVADLSSIGGSATQQFYDDGTNGDATAGDNVFSYTITPVTSTNGSVSLSATITDAQSRSGTAKISLVVNQPVYTVAIHDIHGKKSLTATSPAAYAGKYVQTTGIVTGVGSVGYFLQSKDSDADADSLTPEGIYVYCGSGNVPASAVIGNEVQVTGLVSLYPTVANSHTPAAEITSPTTSLLSTGNALPAAIDITSKVTPAGGLYQLTPYEGMRVSIPSLTVVAPTDGSLSSEANATTTSNGRFYAVVTGTARPFREPGIDIRDTPPATMPANVARFDDNPERILVDSTFFKGSALNLTTSTVLANATGVLDFTYSSDSYYDPSRLLLDSTYSTSNISGGMSLTAVTIPASNELTVAAFNVERFFDTSSSDNIYYNAASGSTGTSSAVNLSATAYAMRLAKVSQAIRNVLGNPDIVALEEVENQTVAADIATQISSDASTAGQTDPGYIAFGTGTSYAPYTNDVGGISVGFLVKASRVNQSSLTVTQYGATDTMVNPSNNNTVTLNDRPPLVLRAGILRTNATDYPVTVIVNHLRSLSGISDSSSGAYVRAKKELQAEYLANLIQSFQAAGEKVISVGDYNVFEFSDGYTDVMATVTGQGALSSDQVYQPAATGLVTPAATDLVTLLPAPERYSYSESGSAQVLDHIVATSNLVANGARVEYAHLDADFPFIYYSDATTPARVSDHDPAVGYFTVPAPVLSASLTPSSNDFGTLILSHSSTGVVFTVTNTGEGLLTFSNLSVTGDYAQTTDCGTTLAISSACSINVVFTPTATGTRTGTLTVAFGSTLSYSASLTGTGRDAVRSATLSPSSASFGSIVVGNSSSATSFTVSNTGEVALTVSSITAGSQFSQTNDCGSSVAIGASCTVNVLFTPTSKGSKTATLTVALSSGNYTAALSGTGLVPDFTLTNASGGSSSSLGVVQGQSISLPLTFTSVDTFGATVTVTCAATGTAPTGVTCTPPAAFTVPASGSVTKSVTFTTTGKYVAGLGAPQGRNPWQATLAFAVVGIVLGGAARNRRLRARLVVLAVLALMVFALGCGNDRTRNPNATQTGVYTYTITATSGTLSHTQNVTLTVVP